VLLALWVAAAGTSQIPINGHEVYVAETAREMQERGDWLIPYFNGELRLNKPPLNYWLTGAIAWLAGGMPIQDWHARAVSALAAVGLVLCTLALGRCLYRDTRVAELAALLLISSVGYFTFSHDARPDMLYALGCAAGYTALAYVWQRPGHALAGWAMWSAFALATLAKGPHVPAILLAASAGFLRWRQRQSWRAIGALLMPWRGVLLLLALTLPWWWWLHRHIGSDKLSHSQLGGALLTLDWKQLLNPYHLLRALQLSAPWPLLLPPAVYWAWRQRRLDSSGQWLLAMVLLAALVLGFGSQRRWFYMLPLLPALCVLMAGLLAQCLEEMNQAHRWLGRINTLLWLLACIAAVALFWRPGCCGEGHLAQLVLAQVLVWPWLGVLLWRRRRAADLWFDLRGSAVVLALTVAVLSDSPALWTPDRFYVKAAVAAALPHLDADTPAVALDENPMAYIFYLRRTVQRLNGPEALGEFVQRSGKPVLAIIDSGRVLELHGPWAAQTLTAMPRDAEEPKTLLLLRPAPAALP
jgi:4-amino-4-deoxy-L-arabinose transferase-like glycosyltransferase